MIRSFIFALTAALTSPALAQSAETLVDRIVAVADGTPVLYTDVMEKVKNGPLVVVSDYPADEHSPEYERALQDSINFELIMAKARDLEIDVRDDEVESEIASFLERGGLNREGLQKHLDERGIKYDDYKKDFKDQMVLRQFQGRVIRPLVKITDKDVETFYLKKSGATSDLVELTLRQILISNTANATPEVAEAKRKLAQEVHQKLVDGMAFPEAVKIYSDDTAARENGGLMKSIRLKDLAAQIRAEVENLEIGQFTAPVRTALGFHIFFLEAKQFSGSQEFQAQKKQLEYELLGVELISQTRRWLTEQRQKSKVEVIAE